MNKDFEENGYTILQDIYSKAELDKLEIIVNTVFEKWLDANRPKLKSDDLINIHSLTGPAYFCENPQDRIDLFNLISQPALTDCVSQILDDSVYFHGTQLFFNPINKDKLPYWHRDFQYSGNDDNSLKKELGKLKALHLRIALIPETGLELIPGSHKRWDTKLESDIRFERNGHKNSEPLPFSQLITLERGDVLIFDAQMLHRGCYSTNPQRKAFDICVGTPHPMALKGLSKTPLPNQKDISLLTNPCWFSNALSLQK